MLDCLILGDSIAKGISDIRTECVAYVQSGINSQDWNDRFVKKIRPARTTIISLGSNDYKKLNTEIELVALRSFVNSEQVFWIIPAIKPEKQELVKKIARLYGDTFVIIPELSQDKVHPTYNGYKQLGTLTKQLGK
jgi:heptaprenylglyceryl phosphate synthase